MKAQLPIETILPEFKKTLAMSSSLVLSAAPGAGKTTRIPPEILGLTHKEVWVLEPRRIAAISAAQRIAEENGWQLGREVGYQVRFENKSSRETRLLFLTEALLMRKLLQDPELSRVGCVVLDEFHERSLHVDLALGALRELQQLARPDLKIVVMSATLDAKPLAEYLGGAPVIDSPGKIFPLSIRYEEKTQLLQTGPDFIERMRRLVWKALNENNEGDLLCFLPGRGEIERLRFSIEENLPARYAIFTLHGQLTLQEQRAALSPMPGRRKIILATNVAESSLTVEGVRLVVDSGLARIQQQHARTGFESLDLVRISKASATQRAGRAARQGPGVVYRAWIPHDERSMGAFETAEILRVDLAETLLLLAALGVSKAESFSWFEMPPARSLEMAKKFLIALGAIDPAGVLTAVGRALREFPVHPRIAKLLLVGKKNHLPAFASDLAALLSEGKSGRSSDSHGRENDLLVKWEEWKRGGSRYRNLDRAAEQLRELVGITGSTEKITELAMEELLLEAFPDRLCRRRKEHEAEAKMAGGRGVKLHPDSSVKNSEFFLALEISEGREAAHALVFQAVGLHPELVKEKIEPRAQPATRIEFEEEKQKFWAVESREWNGLSVGREHRRPAEPSEIQQNLVDIALQRWDRILANNESLLFWVSRLNYLHTKQDKWPLLSASQIHEGLEQACYGENSLTAVEQKELVPYFENLLDEAHHTALEKECPASWLVPSGNRFRIRYTEEQGPQVEVRLQELFGLAKSPLIAGQSLTLILLAPNYRPVQITRDLASFWKNGYPEVRKEMRLRYPKHSWPDDPLTAPPQSKGRAKGALPNQ